MKSPSSKLTMLWRSGVKWTGYLQVFLREPHVMSARALGPSANSDPHLYEQTHRFLRIRGVIHPQILILYNVNNIHDHWRTPRRDGDFNSTLCPGLPDGSVIATLIATLKTFVITIKIFIISTNWLKTVEAKSTFLARNGVRMYFYAQTKLQNYIFIWENKEYPPCFPLRRRELVSHVTWEHANAKQWADKMLPSHTLRGQIVRW